MKTRIKYPYALSVKLSEKQRKAVDIISNRENISLAEAVRFLLDRGLAAIAQHA